MGCHIIFREVFLRCRNRPRRPIITHSFKKQQLPELLPFLISSLLVTLSSSFFAKTTTTTTQLACSFFSTRRKKGSSPDEDVDTGSPTPHSDRSLW